MKQISSEDVIKVVSAGMVGFSLFWLTSHPKSKLKRNLPEKRYKNFSFLPNVKYHRKDTSYHFHHWLLLSICYVPLLKSKRFRKSRLFHGLFLGGILQGMLYKDRFQFTYPQEDVLY